MPDLNKILVLVKFQDLYYLPWQDHIISTLIKRPNIFINRKTFYVSNMEYQVIFFLNDSLIFYYLKLNQQI